MYVLLLCRTVFIYARLLHSPIKLLLLLLYYTVNNLIGHNTVAKIV